jgi:hypothetical protein
MWARICVSVCMCVCASMYLFVYVCVCMCVCMCVCVGQGLASDDERVGWGGLLHASHTQTCIHTSYTTHSHTNAHTYTQNARAYVYMYIYTHKQDARVVAQWRSALTHSTYTYIRALYTTYRHTYAHIYQENACVVAQGHYAAAACKIYVCITHICIMRVVSQRALGTHL